ncbi:2-dehydro-3-deoxygalactonokinase [Rhizobium sp. L1K21]|uniref:2-dehydro-3-deoxygalactonokinase n=1 Tax=Rhizobium sp. L1K21 TaxID=2954933 RepID=UPI00209339FE|nr:2-dehydro-3-deoxygalactonokinase [Rhizobium sp. L1K21]MCO6187676.1 2-dehydro-3-deoxygalactonokinase [Rhizobium sp. L1K21]
MLSVPTGGTMMAIEEKSVLAVVDWGTSHLRIWAVGSSGAVLAERKSNEGMSSTARDRFEGVLESHLDALAIAENVPVIMCGMVGSRQGWAEAGYIPIPTGLDQLGANAVRVPHSKRDIRILPGLSKNDPVAPDVMRGEETQLLGLFAAIGEHKGAKTTVCMPGTHSKWVSMSDGTVGDCVSFMTGDMFAALSGHSVLSHSVGTATFDAHSADFLQGVEASLASPSDILARLFSIRPAGLLQGLSPEAASARLSGYLIGQEIAGAKARLAVGQSVELVGGGVLGALYSAALQVASIDSRVHDGDTLVLEGAKKAAAMIWNF